MCRLRLEPPDEETVERIVEIYRAWWKQQEQKKLAGQEGVGVEPLGCGTYGVSRLGSGHISRAVALAKELSGVVDQRLASLGLLATV